MRPQLCIRCGKSLTRCNIHIPDLNVVGEVQLLEVAVIDYKYNWDPIQTKFLSHIRSIAPTFICSRKEMSHVRNIVCKIPYAGGRTEGAYQGLIGLSPTSASGFLMISQLRIQHQWAWMRRPHVLTDHQFVININDDWKTEGWLVKLSKTTMFQGFYLWKI